MIRVGFIGFSGEWHGGHNYLRNLLYAIAQVEGRSIESVVFLNPSAPKDIVDLYTPYAQVVMTPFLERYQFAWWLAKISSFFGRGQWAFESFLLKNDIQVLFCTPGLVGFDRIKVLNWIPDFQHIHLKNMSSPMEITLRDRSFQVAVAKSARIILSSQDALNDLSTLAPQAVSKTRVLHFVGQVDPDVFSIKEEHIQRLRVKYNLPAKFFYMPNQFWKHKNHIVVFEALHQLKKEGIKLPVVCSGAMHDYRHSDHVENLKKFILEHGLDDEIILLGKIPTQEVSLLYVSSLAVINPSLFEGWSTTVEESKTLGKRVLLSDIPVHREQAPARGLYFDPSDAKDVASKLKQVWTEELSMSPTSANELRDHLKERTLEFAMAFQGVVEETLKA